MKKRVALIIFSVAILGFSFREPFYILSVNKGNISFRSDAPLEIIRASSNELKGAIDTEKKQFSFSIRLQSFQGFNSGLQKDHFNENYLESNKYPDAQFKGKIIEDVDFTKDGVSMVRAKGVLTIHGVPQERIIKAELAIRNNAFYIRSNFTILLADHNIPIPKVVHEKLASEIKVMVNSELKSK
ncbi:MAG: YceI family protein [Chitinophagaceae bacterium]